jgi:hypothetical protein
VVFAYAGAGGEWVIYHRHGLLARTQFAALSRPRSSVERSSGRRPFCRPSDKLSLRHSPKDNLGGRSGKILRLSRGLFMARLAPGSRQGPRPAGDLIRAATGNSRSQSQDRPCSLPPWHLRNCCR